MLRAEMPSHRYDTQKGDTRNAESGLIEAKARPLTCAQEMRFIWILMTYRATYKDSLNGNNYNRDSTSISEIKMDCI
jgi:hypothetical protein